MSKKTVWVLVVFLLALALAYVNFFVYPFQSSRPNYSDVSAEFDKIVFPQDWQITKIIENKGIAGRACPTEGSGCFSKQAFISLPININETDIRSFIEVNICSSSPNVRESKDKTIERFTYYCSVANKMMMGGDYRVERRELSIRIYKN